MSVPEEINEDRSERQDAMPLREGDVGAIDPLAFPLALQGAAFVSSGGRVYRLFSSEKGDTLGESFQTEFPDLPKPLFDISGFDTTAVGQEESSADRARPDSEVRPDEGTTDSISQVSEPEHRLITTLAEQILSDLEEAQKQADPKTSILDTLRRIRGVEGICTANVKCCEIFREADHQYRQQRNRNAPLVETLGKNEEKLPKKSPSVILSSLKPDEVPADAYPAKNNFSTPEFLPFPDRNRPSVDFLIPGTRTTNEKSSEQDLAETDPAEDILPEDGDRASKSASALWELLHSVSVATSLLQGESLRIKEEILTCSENRKETLVREEENDKTEEQENSLPEKNVETPMPVDVATIVREEILNEIRKEIRENIQVNEVREAENVQEEETIAEPNDPVVESLRETETTILIAPTEEDSTAEDPTAVVGDAAPGVRICRLVTGLRKRFTRPFSPRRPAATTIRSQETTGSVMEEIVAEENVAKIAVEDEPVQAETADVPPEFHVPAASSRNETENVAENSDPGTTAIVSRETSPVLETSFIGTEFPPGVKDVGRFNPAPIVFEQRVCWPRNLDRLEQRASDQIRNLADHLEYLYKRKRRVVCFNGFRPGDGCTTLTLCAARELAERGYHLLLADAHAQQPDLAKMLGITLDPHLYEIVPLVSGRLELMPWSDVPIEIDENRTQTFAELVVTLRNDFDFILLDNGSLVRLPLARHAENWKQIAVDGVLLVVNTRNPKSVNVGAVSHQLFRNGVELLGVAENYV